MGIMGLNDVMDRAVDVLRKHMKNIVLYSLCYGLIYTVGVLFLVFGGGIFVFLSSAILRSAVLPIIFISIIGLIAGVMAMASKVGVIKISNQVFSDEKVGLGEALGASFKNLHRVIGILLIEIILFIPIGAALGGIIYFIFKSLDSSFSVTESYDPVKIILIILLILSVLSLIFIILMYTTMFSFALQAAIIEKKGIIASVKRSFGLIKRNFWRIFGITLLMGITIFAIQASLASFIAGILSLLYILMKFLKLPLDYITFINLTFSIANWPLSIISWLIIAPLGTIMTTLLYYNQRFKKEGYDMVLRLRDIQKNDERKQSGELV